MPGELSIDSSDRVLKLNKRTFSESIDRAMISPPQSLRGDRVKPFRFPAKPRQSSGDLLAAYTKRVQTELEREFPPAFPTAIRATSGRLPFGVLNRIIEYLIVPYEPNGMRNCLIIVRDLARVGMTSRSFFHACRYGFEYFATSVLSDFIESDKAVNWRRIISDPCSLERTELLCVLSLLKQQNDIDLSMDKRGAICLLMKILTL